MTSFEPFVPKLFTVLREGISRRQIASDVVAGLVVGIVAVPLAIAFAIASGVSPEKGLLTAAFAGFVISAFGGSRVQIGGPTGAFIVILSGIVATHGLEGLIVATFMAGVILILMGALRLGDLLRFIPHTLIVGFTTGIALIIFSSQVGTFFGLATGSVPAEFVAKWGVYLEFARTASPAATAIGLATVLVVVAFRRFAPMVPGALIALVGTAIAVRLFDLPVETIATRFGSVTTSIPRPGIVWPDWSTVVSLAGPTLTIAMLAALESLLSASVADGMIGARHRPNAELIAQGLANMVSGLFGGIPATGAIARTATNVKSGGRTPIAGMVHAVVVFIVMTVAGPLAGAIPLSALAGILFVVAWNMSEIGEFIGVFRTNRFEVTVLLTTFILTVVADLTLAIGVGFVLSVLLFMRRMADSVSMTPLLSTKVDEGTLFHEELGEYPHSVLVYEVDGPLFFGAVGAFLDVATVPHGETRVLILRLRYVPIVDSTGLKRIHQIDRRLHARGITLLVSGASDVVEATLVRTRTLPPERILPTVQEAMQHAKELVRD